MLIKTKFFGDLEINEEEIIFFPDGILGFEDNKKFVLLNIPENDLFKVLQDIEQEYTAFIVADPWKVVNDYEIDVPDNDLLKINISKKDQIAVFNIITLADVFEKSTINLLAPVIINTESGIGRQYVPGNMNYSTRHQIFMKQEESPYADS